MTESKQGRTVVMVSLTGDEEIRLYDLDPTSGALGLRATSPAHGPSGALFLHPSDNIVYDAHVESTTLASFRLDVNSGELALINKVDTGIGIPAHLITDRAGRFLLTAYYGGGGITVHRLEDDGAIGELVQRIDTGEKAHAILLTTDERFAFVPHVCPNNRTAQFRFDAASGQLSPNDPAFLTPPDGEPGPRHICFRSTGDVAYVVNEQGNTVTAHRFDAERGILEIFQDISTLPADYATGGATAHVELHPNGKWCYASNRGHDSIAGYNIANDGTLSQFGHYPVPASPRSFNIDPTGSYLYCAGEAADRMTVYLVDQDTGALTPFQDYEVGHKPFWVLVTTPH
jgi:6-phosphogluconolactonase